MASPVSHLTKTATAVASYDSGSDHSPPKTNLFLNETSQTQSTLSNRSASPLNGKEPESLNDKFIAKLNGENDPEIIEDLLTKVENFYQKALKDIEKGEITRARGTLCILATIDEQKGKKAIALK